MSKSLVYEVTLDISVDAAPEFDRWLADHVREMLALPGFTDARILSPGDPEGGSAATTRRVVQYSMASREALDRYVAEHAPRMRADGVQRFGDRLKTSRRVLDVDQALDAPPALPGLAFMPDVERCRNCGTPLNGKFCAECGQRHHAAVATLRESLDDFAGTHFGFDTKFFHSIVPLMFRPGFLTREYCVGRQERYIKPFRLYLFASVVFFFLAAFMWPASSTSSNKYGSGVEAKLPAQTKAQTRAQLQNAIKTIDANNQTDSAEKDFARSIVEGELAKLDAPSAASAAADSTAAKAATAAVPGVHVNVVPRGKGYTKAAGVNVNDKGDLDVELGPDGKPKDPTEAQVLGVFNKVKNNQDQFKHQLYQNLPKMMLLFMPIVAMFLKLMYLGSRRLFAEHFIFTLHYHAFVFVVMLVVMLVNFGALHLDWLLPLKKEAGTVAGWYMVIYLFLAMRFFYRQSWLMTVWKFFLLFICYFMAVGITFAAAVTLTAVEI